ncbi:hypothetical protein ABPG72_012868 [Tetrahymena utriculariae]
MNIITVKTCILYDPIIIDQPYSKQGASTTSKSQQTYTITAFLKKRGIVISMASNQFYFFQISIVQKILCSRQKIMERCKQMSLYYHEHLYREFYYLQSQGSLATCKKL